MNNLLWAYGDHTNNVKIFKTVYGYAIESFMKDRTPKTIRNEYKNSKVFSNTTQWTLGLVLIHGELENAGKIIPIEQLN